MTRSSPVNSYTPLPTPPSARTRATDLPSPGVILSRSSHHAPSAGFAGGVPFAHGDRPGRRDDEAQVVGIVDGDEPAGADPYNGHSISPTVVSVAPRYGSLGGSRRSWHDSGDRHSGQV